MAKSWYAWIDGLVARFDSARACAAYLRVEESKLSRWRRVPFAEPTAADLEHLALATGTALTELLWLVWAARKERDGLRARPTTGGGSPASRPPRPSALSPAVAPPSRSKPRRASDKRRRGLAALAGLGLSLGCLSTPAHAAPPRQDRSLTGGILSTRRQAA